MKQGDIFLVDFGINSVGHEYQKSRPALVVQSNQKLHVASLVTVIPFTSKLRGITSDDIVVGKDQRRFFYKIGELNVSVLQRVKEYLRRHFEL